MIGIIARRPLATIGFWIIVMILLLPIFFKIEEAVIYNEESMLPKDMESIRALEIQREIAGGDSEKEIIFIDGVDIGDLETNLRLIDLFRDIEGSVIGRYAEEIDGYPYIVSDIFSSINSSLESMIHNISNISTALYNASIEVIDGLSGTVESFESLNELIRGINELILSADAEYSRLVNETTSISWIAIQIRELDLQYRYLTTQLERLIRSIPDISESIVRLDRAYIEATDRFAVLALRANDTAEVVRLADRVYIDLYREIKNVMGMRSQMLDMLSDRERVGSLMLLVSKTWWDIARTYFYYSADPSRYYELTNLTFIDERYSPLPPDKASYIYASVAGLVNGSNISLDDAVTETAFTLLAGELGIGDPNIIYILKYAWIESLNKYKVSNSIQCLVCILTLPSQENPVAHIDSQLALLKALVLVGSSASESISSDPSRYFEIVVYEYLSKSIGDELASYLAPRIASNNISKFDLALAASRIVEDVIRIPGVSGPLLNILMQYDPFINGSLLKDRDKLSRAVTDLLYSLDERLRSIDKSILYEISYTSIGGEASRNRLAELAIRYIEAEIMDGRDLNAYPVGNIDFLRVLDPEARGLLIYNRSLLNQALKSIVVESFREFNISISDDIASRIIALGYRQNVSRADVSVVSLDILRDQLSTIYQDDSEYLIDKIIEVLSIYDPYANASLVYDQEVYFNSLYGLLEAIAGDYMERSYIAKLADLLASDPTPPRRVLAGFIAEMISDKLAGYLGEEEFPEYNRSRIAALSRAVEEVLLKYDPAALGTIEKSRSLAVSALLDVVETFDPDVYSFIASNLSRADLYALLDDPLYYIDLSKKLFRENIFAALEKEFEEIELKEVYIDLVNRIVDRWPDIDDETIWLWIGVELKNYMEEVDLGELADLDLLNRYLDDVVDRSIEVSRGLSSLDQVIGDLARSIFIDTLENLLDEFGILVSKDRDGFVVLFTPIGDDIYSKYEAGRSIYSTVYFKLSKEFPNAEVYWTGQVAISREIEEAGSGEAERIRLLSQVLVFIVLLVVLESLAAVAIPFIGIFIAAVVSGALIYFIATGGYMDLFNITRLLMITTAFGVGADYTGYLVTRFREEISRHGDPVKAAETSLRRSGPAIVVSALTTMAGFGSLTLGWEFPLFRSLGIALPVTVGVVALVSLTIVPAILSLLGRGGWFWWPRKVALSKYGSVSESRVVRYLAGRAWIVGVIFVLLAVGSVVGIGSIEASHDIRLFLSRDSPALSVVDLVMGEVDPGVIYPITIAIDLGDRRVSDEVLAYIEELAGRIERLDNIRSVFGPTRPSGVPLDNVSLSSIYSSGGDRFISEAKDLVYLEAVLSIDPFSAEALEVVDRVRTVARDWAEDIGARVYVGGASAFSRDLDILVNDIFWFRVLPTATILMIAIFTLIFGGFPASLISVAIVMVSGLIGILLTGFVSRAVFDSPMLWFLPQVVFTAIMGVGMDYNSFYMARAREECVYRGRCGIEGSAMASGAVGRLVIGLAFIVVAAYSSLILAATPGNIQIGVAISISVIVASFMASYIVAPILIAKLGVLAWKPWGMRSPREGDSVGEEKNM